MATGFQSVHRIIKTRFNVNWGATTKIAWDNVDFRPTEDTTEGDSLTEWVRVNIRHGEAEQMSMGAVGGRLFRNVGVVVIQIFVVIGGSLDRSMALADIARGIFEGVTDTGVVFRAPSVREVGQSGAWYQVNVTTEFQWDIQV